MSLKNVTITVEGNLRTFAGEELKGMKRDEIRPIARLVALERDADIDRTWLWNARPELQAAFILEEEASWNFPRRGGLQTVQPVETVEETPASKNGSEDPLIAILRDRLGPMGGAVKPEELKREVASQILQLREEMMEIVSQRTTKEIVVHTLETGHRVNVGVQHARFEALLKRIQVALAGAKVKKYMNIWLVGPAGSGKTTAVENAAKALGLEFEFNGALDSEHKLLGFVDANGKIVSRPFRKAWTDGGVYLFDEVDASMPGACLALNAALANGYCDFPDGKIFRSPTFVCIASGNVWNGPTEDYCGRYKPDAAFANRFIKFRWEYDEDLERAISGNDEWVDYVQGVRRRALAKGVKVIISPRASLFGALLLAGGVPLEEVIEETVRQGLPEKTWDLIKSQF